MTPLTPSENQLPIPSETLCNPPVEPEVDPVVEPVVEPEPSQEEMDRFNLQVRHEREQNFWRKDPDMSVLTTAIPTIATQEDEYQLYLDSELGVEEPEVLSTAHLPFVMDKDESKAFNEFYKPTVQESAWYDEVAGPLVAFVAGRVEGMINLALVVPHILRDDWQAEKITDEWGNTFYARRGMGGYAGDMRKFLFEGEPEGVIQGFAYFGGALTGGVSAVRTIGPLVNGGKAYMGFKTAEASMRMATGMAPHMAKVTNALKTTAQYSIVGTVAQDVNSIGSIEGGLSAFAAMFTDASPDEGDALKTIFALEGEDKRSAIVKYRDLFYQELVMDVLGGAIFSAAANLWRGKKGRYVKDMKVRSGLIADRQANVIVPLADKLATMLPEVGTPAYTKVKDKLEAAYSRQNKDYMEQAEIMAKYVKRNVDKEGQAIQKAELEGKPVEAEIMSANQKAKVLAKQNKPKEVPNKDNNFDEALETLDDITPPKAGDDVLDESLETVAEEVIDNITGTGKKRAEALMGPHEGMSAYDHAMQKLAQDMAEMSTKNQDALLRKYAEAFKRGDLVDEENLIAKILGTPAIRLSGKSIIDNLDDQVKGMNASTVGFEISTEGGKKILQRLADQHGLSKDEVAQFVKNVETSDEAIRMAYLISMQTRASVKHLMKTSLKAAESDDVIDLFQALHAYDNASRISRMTSQLGSIKGHSLQATQWSTMTGEMLDMKIASIRAKLTGDAPIQHPLMSGISEASPQLSKALAEGTGDLATIRATIRDILGGDKGIKDARKMLQEVREKAAKGESNLMGDLKGIHDKDKLWRYQSAMVSYAFGNMLSSPITWMKVMAGGVTQTVGTPTARLVALSSDLMYTSVKQAIGKADAGDVSKVIDDMKYLAVESWNQFTGLKEALEAGIHTFKTRTSEFSSRVQHEYLSGTKTGYSTEAKLRKLKGEWLESGVRDNAKNVGRVGLGVVDDVLKTPTAGAMSSFDEFFKVLHFRASMRTELGRLHATKGYKPIDGLSSPEWIEREIRKQMLVQTSKEGKTAMAKAQDVTLQTPLVGTGEGARANITWEGFGNFTKDVPLAALVMPFTKVIANVSDQFIEGIPFFAQAMGAMSKKHGLAGSDSSWKLLSGVAHIGRKFEQRMQGPENAWKKQQVIGKQLMAIPMLYAVNEGLESGMIQGSGGSWQEKGKREATGDFVPYSIKFGDMPRMAITDLVEPYGMSLRIIIRMNEIYDEAMARYESGVITRGEAIDEVEANNARGTDTLQWVFDQFLTTAVDATPLTGTRQKLDAVISGGDKLWAMGGQFMSMFVAGAGMAGFVDKKMHPDHVTYEGNMANFWKKAGYLKDWFNLDGYLNPTDDGPLRSWNEETQKWNVRDYWMAEWGGVMTDARKHSNPELQQFNIDNAPYLSMPFTRKEFMVGDRPLPLTKTQSENWSKYKGSMKINGKTLHQARLDALKAFKADPTIVGAEVYSLKKNKSKAGKVTRMNLVAAPYDEGAMIRVIEESPSLKAAKSMIEILNKGIAEGKDRPEDFSNDFLLNATPAQHRKVLKGFDAADKKTKEARQAKKQKRLDALRPQTSSEAQDFWQPNNKQ